MWPFSKNIYENETLKELAFPKRFVTKMWPFSKKKLKMTLNELAFPKHILSKKSGVFQRVQNSNNKIQDKNIPLIRFSFQNPISLSNDPQVAHSAVENAVKSHSWPHRTHGLFDHVHQATSASKSDAQYQKDSAWNTGELAHDIVHCQSCYTHVTVPCETRLKKTNVKSRQHFKTSC